MKKVLILISSFKIGGFSKSLVNFLNCSCKASAVSFTVVSLYPDNFEAKKDVPSTVKVKLIEELKYGKSLYADACLMLQKYNYVLHEYFFRYIKKERLPNKYVRGFSQAKLANLSYKLINDFSFAKDFDLVISWCEGYCNYVLVDKIQADKKVGFIHPNYIEAGFSKKIDYGYLKRMDKIVTISELCCETLKEVFPKLKDRIICVPNNLSKDYYERLSKEYETELDENRLNFVTVNRIDDNSKAVFRLIRIVQRLKTDGYNPIWRIIGDGVDFEAMKTEIKRVGLEENILCLGAMSNPYPYMKNSDLYIQQSYYEGRPVSVDEAMLLGTPALITDYSSAAEQVRDGVDGWIAKNEEEQIYDRIKYLMDNPHVIKEAAENLKQKDFSGFEDCSPMIDMINELTKGS